MYVKDLMTPKVVSVTPSDTLKTARALLREYRIHHLLVVENDRVVGILSIRQLATKSDDTRVSEAMLRDFVAVDPSAPVKRAAEMMIGRPAGCLPVMIGSHIEGIITTTDLLRAVSAV